MLERNVLQKYLPNISDVILFKNTSRQGKTERKVTNGSSSKQNPSRKPKHQRQNVQQAEMSRAMKRFHGIPSRREGFRQ